MLTLAACNFAFGLMHYAIGDRHRLWGSQAVRLWRWFGWGLGILLTLAVLTAAVEFHLARLER